MNVVPLGSENADGGVRTTAPRNVPVLGRVGLYAAVNAAAVM